MTLTSFVLGMLAGFFLAVIYATIADSRGRDRPELPTWPEEIELPSLAPIPENPAVIVKPYGKQSNE